jgi:hypothetical protein
VTIDAQAARRAVVGVGLLSLFVSAVVLALAAAHHNAQLGQLRAHGLVLTAQVSDCRGLLGGSGSNAVGYTCRASYLLHGHVYRAAISGSSAQPPGPTVRVLVDPLSPHLLSATLAVQRPSAGVYVLPVVLLLGFGLAAGILIVRWRHAGPAGTGTNARATMRRPARTETQIPRNAG